MTLKEEILRNLGVIERNKPGAFSPYNCAIMFFNSGTEDFFGELPVACNQCGLLSSGFYRIQGSLVHAAFDQERNLLVEAYRNAEITSLTVEGNRARDDGINLLHKIINETGQSPKFFRLDVESLGQAQISQMKRNFWERISPLSRELSLDASVVHNAHLYMSFLMSFKSLEESARLAGAKYSIDPSKIIRLSTFSPLDSSDN